ncbi:hypothetical protein EHS25_009074 [Saitozyma podzolica]|uniref:Autophagy-related protein 101 n=1 Tax=Saitozyma podzolica TaxID=1890683 RepID=A0A427YKS6_9TREE|nr:hypothetical protein EHS25_009074 [Saitozyma podzolica]
MDALNHIHLTVPPQQVKHVLRALLYAIFFHRLMDNVEPETWDILETHVACAPTQAIERDVSSKIDEFSREYLDTGAERGEIAVVFLQKKPRKGWFAVTEMDNFGTGTPAVGRTPHHLVLPPGSIQAANDQPATDCVVADPDFLRGEERECSASCVELGTSDWPRVVAKSDR